MQGFFKLMPLALIYAMLIFTPANALFYDLPSGVTYDANKLTNDFESSTLSSICFCDQTIGACDPNCDCDAECTQTSDQLRSIYGFDFLGTSAAIQTACYNKDDDQLYRINQFKMGIKKTVDNETFYCVEVSDTNIASNIIKPSNEVSSQYKDTTVANKLTAALTENTVSTTNGYQISDSLYLQNTLRRLNIIQE